MCLGDREYTYLTCSNDPILPNSPISPFPLTHPYLPALNLAGGEPPGPLRAPRPHRSVCMLVSVGMILNQAGTVPERMGRCPARIQRAHGPKVQKTSLWMRENAMKWPESVCNPIIAVKKTGGREERLNLFGSSRLHCVASCVYQVSWVGNGILSVKSVKRYI